MESRSPAPVRHSNAPSTILWSSARDKMNTEFLATQVFPGTDPMRSDESRCMESRSHAPVRHSDAPST
eukprot:3640550-Heterocapsa_arctica.AAC.1